MSRNWAPSFALADEQHFALGLSGDIGFSFRHMAHRAARQTSRTQSPVREQRVFFCLRRYLSINFESVSYLQSKLLEYIWLTVLA